MRKIAIIAVGAVAGWVFFQYVTQQSEKKRLLSTRDQAIRTREQMATAVDDYIEIPKTDGADVSAESQDDLTVISGIGPVFQDRLRQAGIVTYAQLAASTPDQVREAIKATGRQKTEVERWVEEAAALV
ncbi:MAG: DUF4332 domain-containing protein [Chloroflexota bacterium]|nr:DUF4332 domain-containing protein [Chloroflexota bacterium]